MSANQKDIEKGQRERAKKEPRQGLREVPGYVKISRGLLADIADDIEELINLRSRADDDRDRVTDIYQEELKQIREILGT